ncbi:MAG TPA: NAD(P)/FAD-dependent oxidoreductase [Gemmatimonadales bacterium]|jgi:monoamine oxidase|nr:NAD(P)/FAD-dependent oxidoreductase [Gemmatimonadales bacterium]
MDTIIIGAGLAGLAAATRLLAAGRTVTIIEARDRIGGRVHTVSDPGTDVGIDLGAEWIGDSGMLHDLLGRHGVTLHRATGHHHYSHHGTLDFFSADADIDETGSVLERLRATAPHDMTLIDALARMQPPLKDDDRQELVGFVQGFNAADAARVSVDWLLEVERNQPAGGSECRAPAGAGIGPRLLANELDDRCTLHLGTAVREIRWQRGRASVIAERDGTTVTFEAEQLIITVPLPLLHADEHHPRGIRFTPALTDKLGALDQLVMGNATKVVLVFREPFWHTTPERTRMLMVHAFDQPLPTWWTANPLAEPIITGWAAGPGAERFEGVDHDTMRTVALRSLAAALGVAIDLVADLCIGCHTHDWYSDPFALGAYTYVAAGGTGAPAVLAEPVQSTLFFAGEATASAGYNATMEGAFRSGWRAAGEVLGT